MLLKLVQTIVRTWAELTRQKKDAPPLKGISLEKKIRIDSIRYATRSTTRGAGFGLFGAKR